MTQDTTTTTFSQTQISEATARALVSRAVAVAERQGSPMAIAVCDTSGTPKAIARMDGASSLTYDIAIDKALTAAAFGLSTHEIKGFLDQDAGAANLSQVPRLTAVPGGYPLFADGALIGAVGVSGGHYSEDQAVAEGAIAELGLGSAG
ncbi:hypothetical protein PAI11_01840 [Patulibacter medicamentivorans]|uniref:Heme-binding protein n=1 Tax=Patulibacter medicamentivorans TaxID=1097667 RepID=H0E076_9ACTN|nr:heme-binding protein [Patulibacter medicamentivorans]EHN12879.1 hypothetical protein PAI11_01840 [Patulibacter medicamentivorans]